MPVHANTKIEPWVNDYYPAFYDSLTSKENWTYDNYSGDLNQLAAWEAYFTQLMSQINSWATAVSPAVSQRSQANGELLIRSIYAYVQLVNVFDEDSSDLDKMDAWSIYNVNGYAASTLNRAIHYYNDMLAVPPYTSVRMAADLAALVSPYTTELANFNATVDASSAFVTAFQQKSLFEDSTVKANPRTKQQQAEYIFTTLHMKYVVRNVTGIAGITVPPYIPT